MRGMQFLGSPRSLPFGSKILRDNLEASILLLLSWYRFKCNATARNGGNGKSPDMGCPVVARKLPEDALFGRSWESFLGTVAIVVETWRPANFGRLPGDRHNTVPYNCDIERKDSAFRTSQWHERGWTLQELIAPEIVVFVTGGPDGWSILGSKADLADVLHEITNVPASILKMETEVADIGIAARMSWAALRKTTRLEDQAYCLMGNFRRVHVDTLRGRSERLPTAPGGDHKTYRGYIHLCLGQILR